MEKLEYIATGTYGIIMKETINQISYIIKQQMYDNDDDKSGQESTIAKLAYSENPDIFIKCIKFEVGDFNRAEKIDKIVPFLKDIPDTGWYQYIYMEYMELGDLYNLNKSYKKGDKMLNIINILGCYFNGLYILHNKLNIIHGDMTSLNILVRYVGLGYKQNIIYKDKEYSLITDGYMFKITDFGISEYIERIPVNSDDIMETHIYRDYLLLYYIYFHQKKHSSFLYYNIFTNLIKETIYMINEITFNYKNDISVYEYYFYDNYNYFSICKYFNKYHSINKDSILFTRLPENLLDKFLELYSEYFVI
jgi:hypothetical protein